MKEYDRQSRKWIGKDEAEKKRNKREKCKGGRDHDYVEVLPYGVEAGEGYAGDPQPYYDAQEAIADFTDKKNAELAAIGIITKGRAWRPTTFRIAVCSVCMKQKYINDKL